jgi:hypothetical protein
MRRTSWAIRQLTGQEQIYLACRFSAGFHIDLNPKFGRYAKRLPEVFAQPQGFDY